MIIGHDSAVDQFRRAWDKRSLHHAWLLAGPRGVGKATFARAAAVRMLCEAAGPPVTLYGLETPGDHPIARLIAAGSHPDMRWLERIENEKTGNLNRNITVKQVRALGEFLGLSPALSPWRVAVIDTVDELEPAAANALLKMLEEPPSNTVFLLVSHVPGRLLPTIRSRCRRLQFQTLGDDVMASILDVCLPETSPEERKRLIPLAGGSAGRAVALAALDVAPMERSALQILRSGDPDNSIRSGLASQLARKPAGDRYAAFLELLPGLVASEARQASGGRRERLLGAYDKVRELSAIAPRLSLDPATTVFQLGGILASAAQRPLP